MDALSTFPVEMSFDLLGFTNQMFILPIRTFMFDSL